MGMGRPMIKFIAQLFTLKILINRLRARDDERRERPQTRSAVSTQSARRRTLGSGSPRAADESPVPTQRPGQGGPDTPLQLEPTDWKQTAKRTLTEIKADRVTLIAAGMAYYMFLAIFPAIIAFTGILGLVEIDTQPIVEAIRDNLPGSSGGLLVAAVQGSQRASEGAALGATLIGIAVALWSASSGFVALQKGLNIAYDVPEDRKFVGARGVALLLIVATGLLGGVPSPFFTFGDATVFTVVAWILTVAAVVILFALFYYFGPKRERPAWQWVSAGGLVGAFIWITASAGFAIYAGDPNRYAKTYGEIGAVIALIFWLYLTSVSILVGGELNAELERQASKQQHSA